MFIIRVGCEDDRIGFRALRDQHAVDDHVVVRLELDDHARINGEGVSLRNRHGSLDHVGRATEIPGGIAVYGATHVRGTGGDSIIREA